MKETEKSTFFTDNIIFSFEFCKVQIDASQCKSTYGICIVHNNVYVDKETRPTKLE